MNKVDIIPRGGTCRECHLYVLWGDIIRGCYRRQKNEADIVEDPDSGEDIELSGGSDIESPGVVDVRPSRKGTETQKGKGKVKGKRRALSPVGIPNTVKKGRKGIFSVYISCRPSDLLLNLYREGSFRDIGWIFPAGIGSVSYSNIR